MQIFTNRNLLVLCALFCMVLLAACGGSNEEPAVQPDNKQVEQTGSQVDNKPETPKTPPGTLGKDFDEIVELAKQEGKVVWWGNSPYDWQMEELEKAFNERFNSNIKIEQLQIHNNDMGARMAAEKAANKHTGDTVNASEFNFLTWVEEGFLQPIDWDGLFGEHLPGVSTASVQLLDVFHGTGIAYKDLIYGVVYNTKLVDASEVPKTWDEVVDPKWKGQLAVDPGLSAVALLSGAIGEEAAIEFAQKLIGNEPIYGKGSPQVLEKVVTGEAKLALVANQITYEQMSKGAPVNIVYPTPLPVASTQQIGIHLGAPNPNAATLFSAWLVSDESMEIHAPWGLGKADKDAIGTIGDFLRENNLGNPIRYSTKDQLEAELKFREVLKEITANN